MSIFTKEFKEELSNMSSKEKDKLILRLLKKDVNLAKRLHFELLDTSSVDDRREIMERHIISKMAESYNHFYAIAYLNVEVRWLSGDITAHVRTTKDKFGEASLNLLLLNEILRLHKNNILTARPPAKLRKFSVAIIARVFKVLLLINKMDVDFFIEFKDDLRLLGEAFGENDHLMHTAIRNGLDVNWLLRGELPGDLLSHYKNLKAQGFL